MAKRQIGAFVDYNNERYHESLSNVTPANVYFGRVKAILREREKIKKQTIRQSDNQTIRQSDNQTIRQSDNQTIRQSDNQTIRQSDNQTTPLATPKTSRIINYTNEPEPPMLKPL